MKSIFISFTAALYASVALAIPTASTSPDSDLDLPEAPGTYTVRLSPNSPPVQLTGTVDEVYTQLRQLNPNYDSDWKDTPTDIEYDTPASTTTGNTLVRRKGNVKCWGGDVRPGVSVKSLEKAIAHIRSIGHTRAPSLSAWECEAVSCTSKVKVRWCNNSPNFRRLPSKHSVADGAQEILNECRVHTKSNNFSGYTDHFDHWRVSVGPDDCS